jgi:hypothetical protein
LGSADLACGIDVPGNDGVAPAHQHPTRGRSMRGHNAIGRPNGGRFLKLHGPPQRREKFEDDWLLKQPSQICS